MNNDAGVSAVIKHKCGSLATRTVPDPEALGLERLIRRLVAEDGFRDGQDAATWISRYEQFFSEASRSRAPLPIPCVEIDKVWQRHMLDTAAYRADCLRHAGAYIHRRGAQLAIVGEEPDGAPTAAEHGIGDEDISHLVPVVIEALEAKPVPAPWIDEAKALLQRDPELALREYRRFLEIVIDGGAPATPSKLIDEFWHQHILRSEEYRAFCERVAGRYLYHRPHYERTHASHEPQFAETKRRYRRHFGTSPNPAVWGWRGESASTCGSSDPPPLYEKDRPRHVRVLLVLGEVDSRHRGNVHPVLAAKGMSVESWDKMVADFDTVRRRSPAEQWSWEFKRDRGAFIARFALAAGLFVLGALLLIQGIPNAVGQPKELSLLAFSLMSFVGAAVVLQHSRPDPATVRAAVAKYAATFGRLGIEIRPSGGSHVLVSARLEKPAAARE